MLSRLLTVVRGYVGRKRLVQYLLHKCLYFTVLVSIDCIHTCYFKMIVYTRATLR